MADDIERRSLYPMPLPPRIAGRLSTMAQPYPDRLYEQFCALRSNGVDVMVSLQPAAERQAAGLEGEPAAADGSPSIRERAVPGGGESPSGH